MGMLSSLFGNSDSFKVKKLKEISDAIELMNPLQSYDPKRNIKLEDLIRYPTLAIGAGKILNILRQVNNKKELKRAIEDGDISKKDHEDIKRMCESFTRKIERIEGEIRTMSESRISGIKEEARQVNAGFIRLKELIPRLAKIVSEC